MQTLMGVTFSEGKSAYFSLNFPIMSPNGLDFSMSFWIKVDLADGTARCILQSENYGQYRFLYVNYLKFYPLVLLTNLFLGIYIKL